MSFLSSDEREFLKRQHKAEHDKRICDRIKAVLLFDEGWSHERIAHVLLLTDEAIRQHLRDYTDFHKLKPENRGYAGRLNPLQTDALLIHLREHTYLYAKEIVAYVNNQYQINYTVEGMTFWLKAHGFSYKKPTIIPGKANLEVQQNWIREYEKLKRDLPHDEAICFIDGVHPTHNTQLAYGWIPKGKNKLIKTNTGRERLNLSGMLDILTKKVLIHEDETLNTASTMTLLQKIEEAYPKANKIHIFCDNARYYKNKEVMKHLQNSKIEMHFLPAYSPNLNPIERLWKLMKEKVLYNRYYEKFKAFREAVIGFLQRLKEPEMQDMLQKRLTDKFHLIKPAA